MIIALKREAQEIATCFRTARDHFVFVCDAHVNSLTANRHLISFNLSPGLSCPVDSVLRKDALFARLHRDEIVGIEINDGETVQALGAWLDNLDPGTIEVELVGCETSAPFFKVNAIERTDTAIHFLFRQA